MEKQIATFKDYAIFMADKTSLLEIAQFVVKENYSKKKNLKCYGCQQQDLP